MEDLIQWLVGDLSSALLWKQIGFSSLFGRIGSISWIGIKTNGLFPKCNRKWMPVEICPKLGWRTDFLKTQVWVRRLCTLFSLYPCLQCNFIHWSPMQCLNRKKGDFQHFLSAVAIHYSFTAYCFWRCVIIYQKVNSTSTWPCFFFQSTVPMVKSSRGKKWLVFWNTGSLGLWAV